jgi:hypothetical protein
VIGRLHQHRAANRHSGRSCFALGSEVRSDQRRSVS